MRLKPPRGWCLSTSRIEISTVIRLERVTQLEQNELDELVIRSLEESFNFVQRLQNEYQFGVNRFDRPGEVLLLARDAQIVIAVIGLNLDPRGQPGVMRLRHFYVLPNYRSHGLGQNMLLEVIELARAARAKVLELHTDNQQAARFYERNGFQRLDSSNLTHDLEL
jgi:ribosomal protein S18 acetylase RimI-like enzyme